MRRRKFNGIIGDLPDFVSPIDGKVVHGRAGLREHNKRHNVTNADDFKGEWEKKGREREEFYRRAPDPERARDIAESFNRRGKR